MFAIRTINHYLLTYSFMRHARRINSRYIGTSRLFCNCIFM